MYVLTILVSILVRGSHCADTDCGLDQLVLSVKWSIGECQGHADLMPDKINFIIQVHYY